MLHHTMKLAALMTLAAVSAASPAAAGGAPCCACGVGCAPTVEVLRPVPDPFYIVDQGPDYSGPGIVVVPGVVEVNTAPAHYPYVGRDYSFAPYPHFRRYVRAGHYYVPREYARHVRVSTHRKLLHARW